MPKKKSDTVEQYSPFITPNAPVSFSAESAAPKAEPAEKAKPKPAKLDIVDLARKLLVAIRERDEDVVAAVLRAISGAGKGA